MSKIISAGHICIDITPVFPARRTYDVLGELLEPGKLILMEGADVHTGGSVANTGLAITHMNLLDNTVEGVSCERDNIFSVQYHPESAPGPQDSTYLFDQFIHNMEVWKNAKKN